MRTSRFRTVLAAGLMLLGAAGVATAQDRANLLTSIEVKRLVANAQPQDHERLQNHFVALTDEYARQAQRDLNAARTLGAGNPRRSVSVPSPKYVARANEETRTAAALRELAEHHGRLAAGLPSEPPKDSARFDAGYGAPEPTEKQLKELAAGARTARDHQLQADYYTEAAASNGQAADRHAVLARMHRVSGLRSLVPAMECERLVTVHRKAEGVARAAAEEHTRHAAQVG